MFIEVVLTLKLQSLLLKYICWSALFTHSINLGITAQIVGTVLIYIFLQKLTMFFTKCWKQMLSRKLCVHIKCLFFQILFCYDILHNLPQCGEVLWKPPVTLTQRTALAGAEIMLLNVFERGTHTANLVHHTMRKGTLLYLWDVISTLTKVWCFMFNKSWDKWVSNANTPFKSLPFHLVCVVSTGRSGSSGSNHLYWTKASLPLPPPPWPTSVPTTPSSQPVKGQTVRRGHLSVWSSEGAIMAH